MKITEDQNNKIILFLQNKIKKADLDISRSIKRNLNKFKLHNEVLLFNNKPIINDIQRDLFLTEQYNKYPYGRDKFFQTIKQYYEGISRLDVVNFLKKSATNQLHMVPPKEKVHQPILSHYPLDRLEIDLIDLNDIKGFNNQNRYVLTIIDHFSKYAWTYPLTKKTDEKVYDALKEFIDHVLVNKKIHIIQSDNGSEFINHKVKQLFNDHDITHITTTPYSPRSNGCIERFNRTLKQMIFKRITQQNRKDFIHFMEDILQAYNNSYHTTIKTTPSLVFYSNNKRLLEKVENNIKRLGKKMTGEYKRAEIKKGDYVRISNLTNASVRKDKFNKKYIQNYSLEVYKVIGFSRINKTYLLKNVDNQEKLTKRYYEDQLLKISYDPKQKKVDEEDEEDIQIIIDEGEDLDNDLKVNQ